jgi:hypothetical protein
MVINCCSLRNKAIEFNSLLSVSNADIVFGCESWFDESVCNNLIFPSHFDIYRNDRNLNGGGVFIAVKDFLRSELIHCDSVYEFISISCLLNNTKVILVVIYRPPNDCKLVFDAIDSHLSEQGLYKNSSVPVVIAGDVNLPSIDWKNGIIPSPCTYGKAVNLRAVQFLQKFGLNQVVREPTRVVSRNGQIVSSLLDVILVRPHNFISSVSVDKGISDHSSVNAILSDRLLLSPVTNRVISVKQFDKADIVAATALLESSYPQFHSLYQDGDMNMLWDYFCNLVYHIQDNLVPTTTFKLGTNSSSIRSRDVRLIERRCKRAYALRNNSHRHKQHYEALLSQLNVAKLAAERECFGDLNLRSHSAKESWSFINKFLDKSKGIPALKDETGAIIFEDVSKANLLNSTYSKAFNAGAPLATNLSGSGHIASNFSFSIDDVYRLITQTKPTAPGPDKVNIKTLKLLPHHFAPYLYLIFNLSYSSSSIPTIWGDAIVTPVPKKGSSCDPSNYRPISITCCCSKLLERLLSDHLYSSLNKRNFFSKYQFGFRPGYSCESLLLRFWQYICHSADLGLSVDAIFLDFAKAFDKVPHDILLADLKRIGIDRRLIMWIKSFLSNRTQRVSINGILSSSTKVTSGVPQGSVLGPLLFIIFINDLPSGILSHFAFFADDFMTFFAIKSPEDHLILQNALRIIAGWCLRKRMPLNFEKCVSMTFSSGRRLPSIYDYSLGPSSTPLKRVDSCYYLGVCLSSDLKWSKHMYSIVQKSNAVLNALRGPFRFCSPQTKEILYFALVRSLLEYATCVWDPYCNFFTALIEKVQRRAARFVLGRFERYDSVSDMLAELNWTPLSHRRKLNRLLCYHKIFSERNGWSHLKDLLIPAPFTGRGHPFKIFVDCNRTNFGKFSFIHRTTKEWNSLPLGECEALPSFNEFKVLISKLPACPLLSSCLCC